MMKKHENDLGADAAAVEGAGSIAAPSAIARHTEGPWALEFDVPRQMDVAVVTADFNGDLGQILAFVEGAEHPGEIPDAPPREVQLANAHLIKAAPTLKDGCNALIGLIQIVCQRDDMPPAIKKALLCSHRMDEALAALQKAEGR